MRNFIQQLQAIKLNNKKYLQKPFIKRHEENEEVFIGISEFAEKKDKRIHFVEQFLVT